MNVTTSLKRKDTLFTRQNRDLLVVIRFALYFFISKKIKGIEMTEETAFSKSYLLFHDKIERTEWYLSLIESNIDDEQRMRYILNHLMTDRGQWNMARNLILK